MAEETQVPQDVYAKSIEHLRDITKWLLGAFAAVGAALVVGIQLTSIGQFQAFGLRPLVGLLALLLILTGVGRAIWLAVLALTTGETSLEDYTNIDDDDTDLKDDEAFVKKAGHLMGTGCVTIDCVLSKAEEAYARDTRLRTERASLVDTNRQLQSDPQAQASVAQNNTRIAQIKEELAEAKSQINYYNKTTDQIGRAIRYNKVRRQFYKSLGGMFRWSLLVGSGVACFAWAANPPEPQSSPQRFKTPTVGKVVFTEAGQELYSAQLGEDCMTQDVQVVILSAEVGSLYDVVTVPTTDCNLFRFTAGKAAESAVTPAETITLK